jgi:hypothetical protein
MRNATMPTRRSGELLDVELRSTAAATGLRGPANAKQQVDPR